MKNRGENKTTESKTRLSVCFYVLIYPLLFVVVYFKKYWIKSKKESIVFYIYI